MFIQVIARRIYYDMPPEVECCYVINADKITEATPKASDAVIVSTDYGEIYEVKASWHEFKALVGANWISKSSGRNTNEN